MFNPNDYPKTYTAHVAGELADMHRAAEREEDELATRMSAFDAGLCSLGAAIEGGEKYTRDLAEAQMEMREHGGDPDAIAALFGGNEHIAAPVVQALNGWARSIAIAQRAA